MRQRRQSAFPLCTAAVVLAGCAHHATPAAGIPTVRFYEPSEIIVPTSRVGRFQAAGGCVVFAYDRPRALRRPALFPPGTRLSGDGRSILLPNGQAIAFGERVDVAFEAPPIRPNVDRTCGEDPIEVLERARKR